MEFFSDESVLQVATVCFGLAIFHTFFAGRFLGWSRRHQNRVVLKNLFHFLGEVELVFGLWATVFVIYLSIAKGAAQASAYLQSVNYSEAVFVFVIMCMAATRPVIGFAGDFISFAARCLPLPPRLAFYIVALTVGPLLGSFMTEPAAMTVVALLLKEHFYERGISQKLMYASLGLLFVNVSIGGTLSHFAAPPVLMVASAWSWDTPFMFANFGWKAALAIVMGTCATAYFFRVELSKVEKPKIHKSSSDRGPWWLVLSHLIFMGLCVGYHASVTFFLPLFLIFLGWCRATQTFQAPLKIRESLLVGFFLAGLVVLGGLQGWWLKPLLLKLSESQLFWSATALTAVTDNAALTYLGTLVPSLSDGAKYALVAGAVSGGGLTVIANAPNPAGYAILADSFGHDGIRPLRLFIAALPYTVLATAAFLLL